MISHSGFLFIIPRRVLSQNHNYHGPGNPIHSHGCISSCLLPTKDMRPSDAYLWELFNGFSNSLFILHLYLLKGQTDRHLCAPTFHHWLPAFDRFFFSFNHTRFFFFFFFSHYSQLYCFARSLPITLTWFEAYRKGGKNRSKHSVMHWIEITSSPLQSPKQRQNSLSLDRGRKYYKKSLQLKSIIPV